MERFMQVNMFMTRKKDLEIILYGMVGSMRAGGWMESNMALAAFTLKINSKGARNVRRVFGKKETE
jgi:hypothetical protein